MSNVSQRLGWDEERSLDAMNFSGANEPIGTPLSVNPVIIVYDNQTDVEVPLLVDGVLWKTFSAGEAILEDLRANSGIAANYTIDLGTQFSTNAALGTTGFFRISIQFAR